MYPTNQQCRALHGLQNDVNYLEQTESFKKTEKDTLQKPRQADTTLR